MIKVPFMDLYAQYQTISEEIDAAIYQTIRESAYIGGKSVLSFEQAFASYLDIGHCIACANGTDSLEILLAAFNIGHGDEVIVPAMSWISTAEAVSSVGAKPVFVDINKDDFTINTQLIKEKISSATRAIIPVHLYGQPCDMDTIMQTADAYNLIVIEDCAQAHGAVWKGKKAGTWGHAGSFSFYPGKNLGAYGDAGAMVTSDEKIASICRQIANHGQEGKHNHLREGRNSRMDGLQAAVLNVKIKQLDLWTKKRQEVAETYFQNIKNPKVILPGFKEDAGHVFHLFVIRCMDRNALMKWLDEHQIQHAIHYPRALPYLSCYHHLQHQTSDFPVAHDYQGQILSIPIFPELTVAQINHVVSVLNRY
jgi:dTDP-4-amino-4,6-dideoxygalactose transaminase